MDLSKAAFTHSGTIGGCLHLQFFLSHVYGLIVELKSGNIVKVSYVLLCGKRLHLTVL